MVCDKPPSFLHRPICGNIQCKKPLPFAPGSSTFPHVLYGRILLEREGFCLFILQVWFQFNYGTGARGGSRILFENE